MDKWRGIQTVHGILTIQRPKTNLDNENTRKVWYLLCRITKSDTINDNSDLPEAIKVYKPILEECKRMNLPNLIHLLSVRNCCDGAFSHDLYQECLNRSTKRVGNVSYFVQKFAPSNSLLAV